jgi:hypothetical protein
VPSVSVDSRLAFAQKQFEVDGAARSISLPRVLTRSGFEYLAGLLFYLPYGRLKNTVEFWGSSFDPTQHNPNPRRHRLPKILFDLVCV